MQRFTTQILPVLLAVIVAVALWDLLARIPAVPDYLLPSPWQVWQAADADRELILGHLLATGQLAVSGFAIGVVLGILVAILLALSNPLRRAIEPLLIASQAIPPVIFTPILIAALGLGAGPKILVVTLGAFYPVAISASIAMREIPAHLIDLVRAMGASRLTVLRRVRLPGAVAGIVAGAKVSASYVVFSAIIAEWMGSSIGLGVYLQRSQASYQMDQLFAAVAVIAVMGVLLFWATALIGDSALSRFRASAAQQRKVTQS